MLTEETWKTACRLAEARGLVVSPKTRWFTLGVGASLGFVILPCRSWSWRVQALHKHVALWERCGRDARVFDDALRIAPLGPCGRELRWGAVLRPLADFRALELAGHAGLMYPRERGYGSRVQERREEAAERLDRRAAGLECPSCSARLSEPHWDRYAHYRPCGCAVEVEVWSAMSGGERVFFARQLGQPSGPGTLTGMHPTADGAIAHWRAQVAQRSRP